MSGKAVAQRIKVTVGIKVMVNGTEVFCLRELVCRTATTASAEVLFLAPKFSMSHVEEARFSRCAIAQGLRLSQLIWEDAHKYSRPDPLYQIKSHSE